MHRLLARQLTKYPGLAARTSEEWTEFLRAINAAYEQADTDRQLLERSLELVSHELMQKNTKLKHDIAQRQRAEEALRAANQLLEARMKQLELLNRTMMGREERVLELKSAVRKLQDQLVVGQPTPPATQEPTDADH